MEDRDKLLFGAGVGAGLIAIWAAVELFPLLLLGGAGYFVYQGLKQTKENSQWQDHGPDQK